MENLQLYASVQIYFIFIKFLLMFPNWGRWTFNIATGFSLTEKLGNTET